MSHEAAKEAAFTISFRTLLSPRPLETPEVGLVIQQGGRMFMFQAKPQVEVVISKAAGISSANKAPKTLNGYALHKSSSRTWNVRSVPEADIP